MTTLTPGSASPVPASVTTPAILPVWAWTPAPKWSRRTADDSRRKTVRSRPWSVVRGPWSCRPTGSGAGRGSESRIGVGSRGAVGRAVAVPLQERGADALEVGAHPLDGERLVARAERVEDADVLGVVALARAEDVDDDALLVLEQPREHVGELVEDGVAGGRRDGRVEGHVRGVEDVVVVEVGLGAVEERLHRGEVVGRGVARGQRHGRRLDGDARLDEVHERLLRRRPREDRVGDEEGVRALAHVDARAVLDDDGAEGLELLDRLAQRRRADAEA